MTAAPGTDWPEEMSIADRRPPYFFRSRGEIEAPAGRVPQAHALRRAFDGLALDGILCLKNTPFLYFKEVPQIDPEDVWSLHRRFWNQGLAPVLILVTPREVHVYSGLAKWSVSEITSWLARSFFLHRTSCWKMRQRPF
jgi:hypothetical protein